MDEKVKEIPASSPYAASRAASSTYVTLVDCPMSSVLIVSCDCVDLRDTVPMRRILCVGGLLSINILKGTHVKLPREGRTIFPIPSGGGPATPNLTSYIQRLPD